MAQSTLVKANGRKRSSWYGYIKHWQLVLMFLPVIFAMVVFHYIPMYGIVIAFKDFKLSKGIMGSEWVGLLQFRKLLKIPSFLEVFRNTVWISALKIVFGFPAPILLALLINEIRNAPFKKVIQTISYLPHFLSWVVLGGIFKQFLSPSTGFVNQIIMMLGGAPVYFLADPNVFVGTLIVTDIWKGIGWGTIIYLACIAGISTELYEAARVDGANRLQRVLHITLPSLVPVISIQFILNAGNLVNAGFDQIFNLYNENVYRVADVIDTYVYRRGLIDQQYSFSAAVGLFKNIISFALVLFTNVVVKKLNGGEGGIW